LVSLSTGLAAAETNRGGAQIGASSAASARGNLAGNIGWHCAIGFLDEVLPPAFLNISGDPEWS
jgi:hypothetical protein